MGCWFWPNILILAFLGPCLAHFWPRWPLKCPWKGEKIKTMKKTTGVTILMTKLTALPIFTLRIACLEAWEFFDPFWPLAAPGVPINGSKNENWEKLSLASSFCCQTMWWHQFSAFNLQFFLVNWFWPLFDPHLTPGAQKSTLGTLFQKSAATIVFSVQIMFKIT